MTTPQTRYPPDAADAHLTANVPVVHPRDKVATIREFLQAHRFDSVALIAVCEHGNFLGVIRIRDLLPASSESTASELMDVDAPIVAPGTDQEHAAWTAVKCEETAIAVVDQEGQFRGVIPGHRLLAIMLEEHEEDLARIGGFLKQDSRAREASEEPVLRRFRHRLPWLLVGLAGAVAAAQIVQQFEVALDQLLALAFFIPSIIYLADAVGTQTETVVVRGLSLGIPVRRIFGREILTGTMIGAVLGLAAWPFIALLSNDGLFALGVALSIFGASSVASVVAMALPWILDRFAFDPALGSGPVATVIQDLLSIVIYFTIVTSVAL